MVYESSILNGNGIMVTQDTVHLGTKARNRLLKPNINLPMGQMKVSIEHLRSLVKNVSKSVHALSPSDVFPTDRMNYGSFQKIIHDRVIEALRNRVPNSAATVQYLLTFRDITNSFSLYDLEPLQRIFLMYRGIYFLRFWRQYIKNSPYYRLTENFITYNTYTSAEINANSLVLLVKFFRDHNMPERFLPSLFDSQTCETTFRIFRSMTTTQFTKINFGILELIHKIGRLEVQNDILYNKLDIKGIDMPHKRKDKTKIYPLPSDEEISNEIRKAKKEAFKNAKDLNLINDSTEFDHIDALIDNYQFESNLKFSEADEIDYEEAFDDNEEVEDETNIDGNCEQMVECEGIDEIGPEFNMESDSELNENSPLIYVIDENGDRKKVLKSYLIWSLVDTNKRMTNDRTKRFYYNTKKRKL